MNHGFKLADTEYDVGLSRRRDGYRLHVNGDTIDLTLRPGEAGDWVLGFGGEADRVVVATHGDDVWVHLDGTTHHLRYEHPLQRLAELQEAAAGDSVRARMPGSLIALEVEPGERVETGQTLLVMESMKMESTLVAPRAGVVQETLVAAGQSFDKDAVLLTLEPEE